MLRRKEKKNENKKRNKRRKGKVGEKRREVKPQSDTSLNQANPSQRLLWVTGDLTWLENFLTWK